MMGLDLDRLTIRQGARTLVNLTAHVAPGDVLTIMGASGSGKSTLLSALIGTLAPAFDCSGRILLNGQDLTGMPTRTRRIGMLFQDDLLFAHLSVAGNLGFGLAARHRHHRAAHIDAALSEVGLAGFGPRDPATLSGGQRARVALLRTLLAEPLTLLLDEPFSRLDAELRVQIRTLVFDRARQQLLPVVLVTHDLDDARAAGGAIVSPLGVVLG